MFDMKTLFFELQNNKIKQRFLMINNFFNKYKYVD